MSIENPAEDDAGFPVERPGGYHLDPAGNWLCDHCDMPVSESKRYCILCNKDVGYPNVRAAEHPSETSALAVRVSNTCHRLGGTPEMARIDEFRTLMNSSDAVVARNIGSLHQLVMSDRILDVSFHAAVESGQRVPEDNRWDRGRGPAEGALFPNYHHDIMYSALALDDSGAAAYGDYSVFLKDEMISHRASVFEENPFHFNPKHGVFAGMVAPAGYRATWKERANVAIAKLGKAISAANSAADYPGILLAQGETTGLVECIEVHIYGSIHRRAIRKVTGPLPTEDWEIIILDDIRRRLNEVGAEFVTI